MQNRKKLLCALVLLIISSTGLLAQEVISPSGGDGSGSGGSVSFTVGQVVYQSKTGSGGLILEGVQVPYEITVITGIERSKGVNLTLRAYPNPTKDFLTISIDDFELKNLTYYLYDLKGNLLEAKEITNSSTDIPFNHLISGTYLVKVIQNGIEIKTFKVLKSN